MQGVGVDPVCDPSGWAERFGNFERATEPRGIEWRDVAGLVGDIRLVLGGEEIDAMQDDERVPRDQVGMGPQRPTDKRSECLGGDVRGIFDCQLEGLLLKLNGRAQMISWTVIIVFEADTVAEEPEQGSNVARKRAVPPRMTGRTGSECRNPSPIAARTVLSACRPSRC